MLERIVDNVSENNDVKRVIADGAYDSGCCHSRKIIVMQQLKNFERWTAKVKYGSRLIAEIDCILFHQKDVWRMCFSKEVSKHGKGKDAKSVII
jgi:hypothetical protein